MAGTDTMTEDTPPYYPAAPPLAPAVEPPWSGWHPPPRPPDETGPDPTPGRNVLRAVALFVVALLVSGIVGLVVGSKVHRGTPTATPTAATPPSTSATGGASQQAIPTPTAPPSTAAALSVEQIATAVNPSVVNINTTLGNGRGAGTGIVLTSDGLVLTNNHVIADSTDIRVQVGGAGTTYTASVLGYNTTADVALLQLEGASSLKPVTVANTSSVQVGDSVVALGNALGRGGTPAVATGTVIGLHQTITVSDETGQNSETLSGLIEVNARLLPGDSGGPLVDLFGQVIGMDTAASASFRRQSADGYAIPINNALAIAKQIQAGRSSAQVHIGDRALLGVVVQDGSTRAILAAVGSGSPAASIGLAAGDTIVAIDGKQVADGASLRSALDPYHPGDEVSVTWLDAAGQRQQAKATLVKGPPA